MLAFISLENINYSYQFVVIWKLEIVVMDIPSQYFFVRSQQWKHQINLQTLFMLTFGVSIANFKQVNDGWVVIS